MPTQGVVEDAPTEQNLTWIRKQFPVQAENIASGAATYAKFSADAGNHFLKLASVADRKVAWGNSTLTWPGGALASNNLAVTHNLGATPLVVIATADIVTPNIFVATGTYGATTFAAIGTSGNGVMPGAGTTAIFYWIAIG